MSSFELTVEVIDPIGLHARPASQIVKLVKDSGVTVLIGREGENLVKANSPLMLMALKIKTGETLKVSVETDDEGQATSIVAEIQEFLKG
ncbi:MAG: HPr family phosphocarrier protein [Micrococcales bacterium]